MIPQKFKCFIKGESLNTAKTFDMNDVNIDPISSVPHFDIALQYMGFQDANKQEVYAGDVLGLTITPELMDIHQNSFVNSNLGKYIKENPEITDVYLVITPPNSNSLFSYQLYMLRDHKIDRYDTLDIDDEDYNKPCSHCTGEDSLFPQYLSTKGAHIIANLYEKPDFLDKL